MSAQMAKTSYNDMTHLVQKVLQSEDPAHHLMRCAQCASCEQRACAASSVPPETEREVPCPALVAWVRSRNSRTRPGRQRARS